MPRVPLPDVGVTSIRETCTASSEDITPRSSLPDSCVNPVWLSPTSAFGLVREVFAGCYQLLLLPGFSRRYLCKSVTGCLVPYPNGPHRVHLPVSSSVSSAFPRHSIGRLPVGIRERDFSAGYFSRLQTFLYVQASDFARLQVAPTAANISEGSRGFYIRAYRASLPPHAPDMLSVRIQAIDRKRTSTFLDLQPCRPLRVPH